MAKRCLGAFCKSRLISINTIEIFVMASRYIRIEELLMATQYLQIISISFHGIKLLIK